MTTTRRARVTGVATALLVAASMLSGCGGNDAVADPPASSGSSPSGSSPASPSPSVEPASGGLLDTATASVNAPQGWPVTTLVKNQTVDAVPDNGLSVVGLSVISAFGAKPSLQQMARLDIRTGSYTHGQVMPETQLAGEPAFHVHGMATIGTTYDAYGLEHDGYVVTVVFKLHNTLRNPQEIIDSVLATVQLK
ncbi:hypothetical protein [Nocardioides sp. LS1]|uniref:hypothetical protein n=1 Tax=Nocardioides sp. LS1 TaxID=1027620 RepID=UPI000F62130D|nr:hypothetical protein [Nocardioides sp. LS1]GCD89863.1 hypothetical protein NLS1_18690 [Nocardioides sp. LS1]